MTVKNDEFELTLFYEKTEASLMSPVPKIGEFFTENLVRDTLYQFSGKTEKPMLFNFTKIYS
jgi:hypothetical protein